MSAAREQKPHPKTLADLYEDRDLSPEQVRRIVFLLGLATPRRAQDADDRTAA